MPVSLLQSCASSFLRHQSVSAIVGSTSAAKLGAAEQKAAPAQSEGGHCGNSQEAGQHILSLVSWNAHCLSLQAALHVADRIKVSIGTDIILLQEAGAWDINEFEEVSVILKVL